MQRTARLTGVGIVLLTSLVAAVTVRDRGPIFWASVATSIAAVFALWRILKEPSV